MTRKQAQAVLGVAATASEREVRRAFKRLALKNHPDHNPGDAHAHARFVRLCLAYDTLTGARPAAPEPAPTESTPPGQEEWMPPWVERPEPPATPPAEYEDGEPIHYPTPEDIAALSKKHPPHRTERHVILLVLAPIVVMLCALAALEAASGRAPARLDEWKQSLRRSMGRRW